MCAKELIWFVVSSASYWLTSCLDCRNQAQREREEVKRGAALRKEAEALKEAMKLERKDEKREQHQSRTEILAMVRPSDASTTFAYLRFSVCVPKCIFHV